MNHPWLNTYMHERNTKCIYIDLLMVKNSQIHHINNSELEFSLKWFGIHEQKQSTFVLSLIQHYDMSILL